MDSRHNAKPIVGWRALTTCLVSAGLVVVGAGIILADVPAATLVLPKSGSPEPTDSQGPASTPNDTTEDSNRSPDANSPPGTSIPDLKYPPPYSSQRSKTFPVLGAMWKGVVDDAPDAKAAASSSTSIQSPSAPPPMWRWYGYGTPTPNLNPYPVRETYAPVPATWYTQTGATPGAVPEARVNPASAEASKGTQAQVRSQPANILQPNPASEADVPQPKPVEPQRNANILPPPLESPGSPAIRSEPNTNEPAQPKASLGMPEFFKGGPQDAPMSSLPAPSPEKGPVASFEGGVSTGEWSRKFRSKSDPIGCAGLKITDSCVEQGTGTDVCNLYSSRGNRRGYPLSVR